MNKRIEAGFKKVKLFWDAYKMIIGLVAVLTSLGIGGYAAYDEVEAIPEPVEVDTVDELKIIHINPEYALKGHTHPPVQQPEPIVPEIDYKPMINRAVEAFARKHDPQGLGH